MHETIFCFFCCTREGHKPFVISWNFYIFRIILGGNNQNESSSWWTHLVLKLWRTVLRGCDANIINESNQFIWQFNSWLFVWELSRASNLILCEAWGEAKKRKKCHLNGMSVREWVKESFSLERFPVRGNFLNFLGKRERGMFPVS